MEGRKDRRVYELDLHGKKLAKIEGLEKVWRHFIKLCEVVQICSLLSHRSSQL